MKLVTVYGSPTPPGRLAAALTAAEKYGMALDPTLRIERLTPRAGAGSAGNWAETAVETIETADAVLISSPVFRASFPAVLKELLDRLPVSALRSKPVGLLVVGAAPQHYLAVDRHLGDVLSWFGALRLPVSCFVEAGSIDGGAPAPRARAEIGELVTALIELTSCVGGRVLGPAPLAARGAQVSAPPAGLSTPAQGGVTSGAGRREPCR